MSALWSARVMSKDGRRLVIELRAIHPDAGAFVATGRFAFRLIYDEAFGYGPGLVRELRGPLGEAVTLEQTFDDGFLDHNVDRFVASVAVGQLRNAPFDDAALRAAIDRELAAHGVDRSDPVAWGEAWSERWDAFWRDPARVPTATYELEVTDPRWISHLDVGSHWESAAY
jgi:hypothetical protein